MHRVQVFKHPSSVPTTMCTPRSKDLTWGRLGMPPQRAKTRTLAMRLARRRISVTWSASSRVGQRTRVCVSRLVVSESSVTQRKAAVLPLPASPAQPRRGLQNRGQAAMLMTVSTVLCAARPSRSRFEREAFKVLFF